MRVELFPADNGGCGHYRMIWPGEAAVAQGLADVQVRFAQSGTDFLPAKMLKDEDGIAHVVGLGDRDWPDIIVLQRPLNRLLGELIPHLQKVGVKVIVELDDDFKNLDPRHEVYHQVQPRWSPDRNWRWLQKACDQADAITVSTPAIARVYGRAGNAVVLKNYVPERYLKVERQVRSSFDEVTFGWSGHLGAHPHDLQVTRGGLARGLGEAGFLVIGPGDGVAAALQMKRQLISTGFVPLASYADRTSELDVMCVPLDLTPFNDAKSWLKGLEAAAVGCGVLASPTESYRELAKLGLCRLAAKPDHWRAGVAMFRRELTSQDAREELVHRQRLAVQQHGLTIEERAHERVAVWRSVLEGKVPDCA